MAAASRNRRSHVVRAAIVLVCALFVSIDWAPPATAQGFGWFGGIFGGQPQRPYYNDGGGAPPYPGYGDGYGRRYRQRAYREGDDNYDLPRRAPRRRQVEQSQDPAAKPKQKQAAKPAVPAKTPTVFVDVFGDGLGQLLANGLDDSMSDVDDVGIVHKAKGPSGLANTAFYDWPKAIDDMLGKAKATTKPEGQSDRKDKTAKGDKQDQDQAAKDQSAKDQSAKDQSAKDQADKIKPADKTEKIDVAVMMIGTNDRQPITVDGKTYQLGTPEWMAIYRKRVMAIDEAFAKRKIPLVWVGVPITKDDDFADSMAKFNEIYRECAAATGATFVDTWEPFSDADGDFAAYGPDVNGQTVRLRSSDGIYFTKAGARKLAHFVEAHVRRDLEGRTPRPQLPTAAAPATDTRDSKTALVKPEAGPIRDLGETPTAKDGKLVDLQELAARDAAATRGETREEGAAAPAGRADNFRWSPPDATKDAPKPIPARAEAGKPPTAKTPATPDPSAKSPQAPRAEGAKP